MKPHFLHFFGGILAAAAVAAADQPDHGVTVAPPERIAYTIIHKTKMPASNNEQSLAADVSALQPSGEAAFSNRRIDYLIVGNRGKISIEQAGITKERYYVGPYRIMSPDNSDVLLVTNLEREPSLPDDLSNDRFPYTKGFRETHLKGKTKIQGRDAFLYERPAQKRRKQPNKPSHAAGKPIGVRRLFVDATTRFPLRMEDDDFLAIFLYSDKIPAALDLPEDVIEAVKRHVEGSRVERAKDY